MSSSSYQLTQRNGLDRIHALARSVDLAGDLTIKAVSHSDDASECVVVFGFEDVEVFSKRLIDSLQFDPSAYADFQGRSKESHLAYTKSNSRLLLVGVGKWSSFTYSTFRSAVHVMFQALKQLKITSATVDLDSIYQLANTKPKLDVKKLPAIVSRISVLSNHSFSRKLNEKSTNQSIKQLSIVIRDTSSVHQQQLTDESVIANSVIFAREVINERGDRVTPSELERIAETVASAHDSLSINVIKGQGLIDQGLELIRAVGKGSTTAEEPRIIMVEYRGDESSEEKIALVGKGITFDAGGLNIKVSHIADMYMDKSGACSVLAAVKAMAVLKRQVNVVAVLAVAENLVDNQSIKPHTIINTCKGSVEISDTDAEGRLVLADALTMVQRLHKPHTIIDVATLTLAAMVAFGENGGAVLSNSDDLSEKLMKSSDNTQERFWRLPIWPEHHEALEGEYSDFKTFTGTQEDASIAGAFLEKFIEPGVKWAHLDVAGAAMSSKVREWIPVKGTGFSVQVMIDFCLNSAKQ